MFGEKNLPSRLGEKDLPSCSHEGNGNSAGLCTGAGLQQSVIEHLRMSSSPPASLLLSPGPTGKGASALLSHAFTDPIPEKRRGGSLPVPKSGLQRIFSDKIATIPSRFK